MKPIIIKVILRSIARITSTLLLILAATWLLLSRPAFFDDPSSTDNLPNVDHRQLMQHVKILADELIPRSYSDIENLNAAAAYIKTALSVGQTNVYYQSYPAMGRQYHNVIAEFGPDNCEAIVIGAHYDAYGARPGADDNASGVAGLIELGRLLANTQLNRKFILVAYTLEEPPMYDTQLMGSVKHAQWLSEQNISIKFMISLEMIGFYSDLPNSQTFPIPLLAAYYPTRGSYISIVGNMTSNTARQLKMSINQNTELPAYSINAPTLVTGVDFSDHRSYWQQGIDAVMVTDTAFYRNTAYHTDNDTYDRLNYHKMADVVKGVYSFVISQ
jgi:Zn-dependent M28 family amino/carboxypeptidase